jgi:hypothetical protein
MRLGFSDLRGTGMDDKIPPVAPVSSEIRVREITRVEDFGRRLGIRTALIFGRFWESVERRRSTSPVLSPKQDPLETELELPESSGHINKKA